MKAVSVVSEGEARVVDVEKPARAAGEVLLRVDMVGLCGTDLNSFRGRNPMVTYPRVIGHEIAATVVEGTDGLRSGTRVTVSPYTSCNACAACLRGRPNACEKNQTLGVQRDGGMTEWLAVAEQKVYPSQLSARELCLVEPLTVGMHAVARGRVTAADTVAVFGAGGVGLGAIAGAARRGARTIAIDVDAAKLDVARAAGAREVVHSGKEDLRERLLEITAGRGPDVVIEAVGLQQTFRAAVELVAFTGRVVYIGYAKEPVSYETKLFVQKELDILGSRNALPEDFREVIAMLEAGVFPVDRAISAVISMGETPAMLARWSASPAEFTKIVVQTGSQGS